MRIVGGKFRGRAIASPQHEGLRPTSDRVREAVFNILEHGIEGGDVAGKRVIDFLPVRGRWASKRSHAGPSIACS